MSLINPITKFSSVVLLQKSAAALKNYRELENFDTSRYKYVQASTVILIVIEDVFRFLTAMTF